MENKDSPTKKVIASTKVEGEGGAHHSYAEEELRIFTNLVNFILAVTTFSLYHIILTLIKTRKMTF